MVRPQPAAANQAWAVDFVHDSLMSGRRLRALTVIDEWSRESLAIEVGVSLTGQRVTRVLDRLASRRGLPAVIQSDNGPEFTSRVLDQSAYDNQARLQFIEPGKPVKNTFIESFNSRLREECLNEHVFVSLDDARSKIEQWRIEYNRQRPHSSLGYLTPEEFAARAENQGISAVARRLASEAGRRAATRVGLGSKTGPFFARPQRMKSGRKNCDKKQCTDGAGKSQSKPRHR